MAVIKPYDTERYPFAERIARIFGLHAPDLPWVHEKRPDLLPAGRLTADTETRTRFHGLVLDDVARGGDGALRDLYADFIAGVVAPLLGTGFVYQAFPTFRLQLPAEMAVHRWHYDSDPDHGHPDWEINFQIALTEMSGPRATWIESVPGLRDFAPIELAVGQFAVFDGNRCRHGNQRNDTALSRASLDFRVLPWDRYTAQRTQNTSPTAGRRFTVGEYYERFQR